MNGKIVLGALGLGTAGVALWYLGQSAEPEAPVTTQQAEVSPPRKEVSATPIVRNGQVLSTGKDTFKPKKTTSSKPESHQQQATEHQRDTIIWHESEEAKDVLQAHGMIPADVANEAYIEIDREELLNVEVGEYLDLYIPQLGGSYTGEVDFIQQHPNGDRTVEAHIPGAGSLYSAVITLGEEAIYGNLATQEDVFILEGIGDHAWLAPKSAMISNHRENHMPAEQHGAENNNENDADVFAIGQDLSPQQ